MFLVVDWKKEQVARKICFQQEIKMTKNCMEAFSDGVIVIIITIIVLELRVPKDTNTGLLLWLVPAFFSNILSFIFPGIYILSVRFINNWNR